MTSGSSEGRDKKEYYLVVVFDNNFNYKRIYSEGRSDFLTVNGMQITDIRTQESAQTALEQ